MEGYTLKDLIEVVLAHLPKWLQKPIIIVLVALCLLTACTFLMSAILANLTSSKDIAVHLLPTATVTVAPTPTAPPCPLWKAYPNQNQEGTQSKLGYVLNVYVEGKQLQTPYGCVFQSVCRAAGTVTLRNRANILNWQTAEVGMLHIELFSAGTQQEVATQQTWTRFADHAQDALSTQTDVYGVSGGAYATGRFEAFGQPLFLQGTTRVFCKDR